MKQAPRAWFEKLSAALYTFGFVSAKSDQSLFIRVTQSHSTYILVYVDDILITGSNELVVTHLITSLNKEFALKDLGEVNYFLRIEVQYTTEGLHFSQGKYITDLLCKAKMHGANPISTPMTSGQKFSAYGSEPFHDVKLYKSIVGVWMALVSAKNGREFGWRLLSVYSGRCGWKGTGWSSRMRPFRLIG